ncbi:MAG TPA: enoyl-CoA hydratase/isomerase family protein [Terracidiphilus sp.]|nr:enoyl-CoA hydratase/isomerase family protein [Terracidiphilus sp.]
MNKSPILIEEEDSLRKITLNRPERRNAMTPEMQMELIAALEDAPATGCRTLVLTGAGDAFCSGLDLTALQPASLNALEARAEAERVARMFLALHELEMPSIAAVNGPAIGGGAGLAAVCDFTLASPEARFGFTETRIGFVPAVVSAFLTLQIGEKRSRDLLMTGRIIDAEEAARLGLVNEIVPREELQHRARSLAERLAANSPQATRITRRLLATQWKAWLDAAMVAAIEASVEARETEDFREGVAAFLEKRKPSWKTKTEKAKR